MAFGSMMRRHARLGLALGAMALGGCAQDLPTSPAVPTTPGAAGDSASAAGSVRAQADNVAPNAIFKTRPAATAGNVIAGGDVFDVTFNMCPSTDPDAGDELKFTYDFDGDGTVDQFGHCRATHRYYAADFAAECQPAVVCVGDRHPDHAVCQTYSVCGTAPAKDAPVDLSNQTISGSHAPSQMDVYSFTAAAGTELHIVGDTISAATTYDLYIRLSTTPDQGGLFSAGDDNWACSFPPPVFGCPDFTATIPADGTYYLLVGEAANVFAGSVGEYVATVSASAPIGPLTLVSNDVVWAAERGAAVLSSAGAGSSELRRVREKSQRERPQR
jgi:hypothetical protein